MMNSVQLESKTHRMTTEDTDVGEQTGSPIFYYTIDIFATGEVISGIFLSRNERIESQQ